LKSWLLLASGRWDRRIRLAKRGRWGGGGGDWSLAIGRGDGKAQFALSQVGGLIRSSRLRSAE